MTKISAAANVLDYLALGLPEEKSPAKPCLPTVTEGPQLEAVRRKLAAHVKPADLWSKLEGAAHFHSARAASTLCRAVFRMSCLAQSITEGQL